MAAEQSYDVEAFITHWSAAPISERPHYQTFIIQLCRLIGVPAPDDERAGGLDYCFERPIRFHHDNGLTTAGWIDCAKRDCFVLEAKQSRKRRDGGALDPAAQLALLGKSARKANAPSKEALDRVMRVAKRQAENYAKALAEWPPFLSGCRTVDRAVVRLCAAGQDICAFPRSGGLPDDAGAVALAGGSRTAAPGLDRSDVA